MSSLKYNYLNQLFYVYVYINRLHFHFQEDRLLTEKILQRVKLLFSKEDIRKSKPFFF